MNNPTAPLTESAMSGALARARAVQATAEPKEFSIGDVIADRYTLKRDLGRGGGGIVFEAEHKFTQRRVAVKLVSPDAPRSTVVELRARLLREARALARVRHPGIVDILDGGIDDETPYIVLEMLDGGRTLEGLLATRGRISESNTVGLALQLCDALTVAHAADVVHRDLKPGNVMIVREGAGERVKLVDFGIAQMKQSRDMKLTGIGVLMGTSEYMAPEQLLASDDIDLRADVYALGITMFECISGRVPYLGTYQQILLQAASAAPVPALRAYRPEVGEKLAAVIDRAISKDRNDRYATIEEMARAIVDAVPGARKITSLVGPPPLPAATFPEAKAAATFPEAKPTDEAAQRRRVKRAPYVTPVHIALTSGAIIEGRSEDISEGGMLVICRGDCGAKQRATVRFALPMEGKIVTCLTELRWVRVARPSDPDGPRALGFEFVDPSPELRASIARYVELMAD